jgi:CRISPR-associated protein Csa3
MATTALVFIGHTKERIIESIRSVRSYSVDTIVLVVGEQESTGELKARGIAEELTLDLATFFDVETMQIDKKDVMRAAQQITGRIRSEQASGRDVLLNMSGSLRTFSIAAYIAGCITRSKMITAIPKYDKDDNEIGIEDIIDLPALPINMLKDEQLRILAALGRDRSEQPATNSRKKKAAVASETKRRSGGVASLEELVLLLSPKIKKGSDAFATERSRLSHYLKNFEMMGLVTKTKSGKNVEVRLTRLGEMFV